MRLPGGHFGSSVGHQVGYESWYQFTFFRINEFKKFKRFHF